MSKLNIGDILKRKNTQYPRYRILNVGKKYTSIMIIKENSDPCMHFEYTRELRESIYEKVKIKMEEKMENNKKILETLLNLLRSYPELRLGQLLENTKGKEDWLYLTDDEILNKIKKYQKELETKNEIHNRK